MKTKSNNQKSGYKETPYFKDEMYEKLPEVLRGLLLSFRDSKRQKDILFFSIINVLSGCFPNVFGYYFGKKVFCNTYGIIGGPPASGKNVMLFARQLGESIHQAYDEIYRSKVKAHMQDVEVWKQSKTGPKPIKPQLQLFYLPGNSTAPALLQLLDTSKRGVIVESEVDTIALMFGQKYGDYSDILRKAFHHEPISLYRKIEREYILIESACLTLLLTGTHEQLSSLLKSAENGLFSRIMFYGYDSKPQFLNPFLHTYREAAQRFESYGYKLKEVHFDLLEQKEREFMFTEAQKQRFLTKFPEYVDDFYENTGSEGVSIVMRLGLIFYRIAMILTVVRNHKGEVLTCDDRDFDAANLMVDILAEHSLAVLSDLPSEEEPTGIMMTANDVLKFLPQQFETRQVREPLAKKGISKRTAFRILNQLCNQGQLEKIKTGTYRKTNNQ